MVAMRSEDKTARIIEIYKQLVEGKGNGKERGKVGKVLGKKSAIPMVPEEFDTAETFNAPQCYTR